MGKFVIKATKTGYTYSLKAGNGEFEIYKDKAGEFRFRLKAKNGEIIAASEGYVKKDSCKKGIASVRKNSENSPVIDPEPPKE